MARRGGGGGVVSAVNVRVRVPQGKVWVATVDTDYSITAVALDPESAIMAACERALEWFRSAGSRRFTTPAEVREWFDVHAYAVPLGTAVVVGYAEARR
jgi:hypothetical protein